MRYVAAAALGMLLSSAAAHGGLTVSYKVAMPSARFDNPDGIYSIHGFDINDAGQVAGDMSYVTNESQTFIYDPATDLARGIGTRQDQSGSSFDGYHVNNRGHALGTAVPAGGTSAAPYFYDGSVRPLGLYQGTFAPVVSQMNDNDVVIGHAGVKDASGQYPNWTWTPTGGYADLARYNGQQTGAAYINNAGVIVGSALNATTNRSQAVVWSSPTAAPVAVPGTPDGSFATSVNNLGQIVGQVDGPNGTRRGFLYDGQSLVDLGTFRPREINDRGVILGTDGPEDNREIAVWANGEMTRLRPLLSQVLPASYVLSGPDAFAGWGIWGMALNNQNQIVTQIINTNQAPFNTTNIETIVISVQVPEPGVLSVAAAAAPLLLGRRARRTVA